LVLGLLAVAAPAAAQSAPALDQFLCLRAAPTRQADRALRFTPRKGVGLRDRLGDVQVDVKKPVALCVPTDAPDVPVSDAATHLEDYAARRTRTRPAQPRVLAGTHRVTNRFGAEDFDVKTLNGVLVPTAAAFDAPPDALSNLGAVDHFSCYGAGRATGLRSRPASVAPLPFETALGTLLIDVRAPVEVCLPAEIDGQSAGAAAHVPALACYRAKLARTKPPQADPFPRRVATVNRFGSEALTLNATLELCVPSAVTAAGTAPTPTRTFGPTPTPTLTPPPDFSLRVEPASVTVNVGESTRFTATAVFKNGDTQDFTERVKWISSTGVATAPNAAGDRGRIDTVDGGSTVVSALDEATGVSSNDTNESALLTVTATLERIELLPIEATRGKGESIRLRATGHFAGGFTRDIADRLDYFSSNTGIANPTNGPTQALRSRIVAVHVGTATISAVEPISGLTSTATDDDVAITVVPPLERCVILPIIGTRYEVGAEEQLTARGYYPGGFERNLTQQVVWTSSAPDVMEATNREGDRSRIIAVGGGQARISATDSITGRACEGEVWVAVGVPTGIYLTYDGPFGSGRPFRAGKTRRVAAVELFNPGYFRKRITEQVVLETSNPAILAAPNTPGDRGLIVGVGSGTASVIARDPATGRSTQPLYFRVLDGLTRIRAQEYGDLTTNVGVGHFIPVRPYGLFADGWALLAWEDFTVVSSNPDVVSNPPPYSTFRGIAPGFATLHVIDNQTGISSEASGESLNVGVRGALERISVLPRRAPTERVGVPIAFGAKAHYVGGVSELATWFMSFSSSNPSVAVNGNDFWVRGQMIPLAGGTTVIDATDPETGISSADSGDGTTLTVLGPLQQLEITPSTATRSLGRSFSFTAIGRDAGGREMNLTQRVQWSSTNTAVAVARNVAANRSRIDSVGLGTTTIFATDPESGLTSSDTGDDATFVVDGVLASLTLSAEVTQVSVNGTTQLTATGHLDDGTTVNLTQEVEYTSSDPAVAKADNTPGDRSRIVGLKPGTVTISARNPGTGLQTAPGGRVTLTVVAP
jgi:hypothetical protein